MSEDEDDFLPEMPADEHEEAMMHPDDMHEHDQVVHAAPDERVKVSGTKMSGSKLKKMAVPIVGIAVVVVAVVVLAPTIAQHLHGAPKPVAMTYKEKTGVPMQTGIPMQTGMITQGMHVPGTPDTSMTPPPAVAQNSNVPEMPPQIPSAAIPPEKMSTPVNAGSDMPPGAIMPSSTPEETSPAITVQMTSMQTDFNKSLSSMTDTLQAITTAQTAEDQKIDALQASVVKLSDEVASLSDPKENEVSKSSLTSTHTTVKPAEKMMSSSMAAPKEDSGHILTGWKLRGISQTAAAFVSPDGYNVTANMGGNIRGLFSHHVDAKLITLSPYNGSWEAVTTAGIIRP
jgi:hypothetical protein